MLPSVLLPALNSGSGSFQTPEHKTLNCQIKSFEIAEQHKTVGSSIARP